MRGTIPVRWFVVRSVRGSEVPVGDENGEPAELGLSLEVEQSLKRAAETRLQQIGVVHIRS